MAMNKMEREILAGVIRRLEGASASPAVKVALETPPLSTWLRTWILPPLRTVANPERSRYDLKVSADGFRGGL